MACADARCATSKLLLLPRARHCHIDSTSLEANAKFFATVRGTAFWSTCARSATVETSYTSLPRTCPRSTARVQEWEVCPTRCQCHATIKLLTMSSILKWESSTFLEPFSNLAATFFSSGSKKVMSEIISMGSDHVEDCDMHSCIGATRLCTREMVNQKFEKNPCLAPNDGFFLHLTSPRTTFDESRSFFESFFFGNRSKQIRPRMRPAVGRKKNLHVHLPRPLAASRKRWKMPHLVVTRGLWSETFCRFCKTGRRFHPG